MSTQPKRRRLEPGIYERVGPDGQRLGLEVVFKDAAGKTRRRAVKGGLQDARDTLAQARTRRVRREAEPNDPRVSFDAVCDAFEAAHVAGLRPNSQQVYRAALKRLRVRFRGRRLSSITKPDLRAFVAAERTEGLKANTIASHLKALSAIYTFARDDLDMPVTMPRLKLSERPRPADDQREHRVLTDTELATVLSACSDRTHLYFRLLAETGARKSEALGLTPRRIGQGSVTFAEQLADDGKLAPLKTRQSKRTIEVTRALAAELRLAAGDRVFDLDHDDVDYAWGRALKMAGLAAPQPVIHDLRHTHVSGLIADGRDPVEIAARIGDTLETTLRVYSHEFDARRRGEQRRAALEARYGAEDGNPTGQDGNQQTATDRDSEAVDLAAARAGRKRAQ
jgi:integrase